MKYEGVLGFLLVTENEGKTKRKLLDELSNRMSLYLMNLLVFCNKTEVKEV